MRRGRPSDTKFAATQLAPFGRRELNRIDKLERIRRAAATLFGKQGYEDTTTLSVAKLAGIANGTLFLYARTKVDLLELVMAKEIDDLIATLGESVPRDVSLPGQVWHVFRGLLKYHHQRKELSRIYVRESALPISSEEPHERFDSTGLGITHLIEQLVLREQAAGRLRQDANATEMAYNLFWLFYGNLTALLRARGPWSFAKASSSLRRGLEQYYEGVRATGA